MPLEVIDLRSEQGVPDAVLRRHGGWDRPELSEAGATVRRILADVRADGDTALLGYIERYDHVALHAGQLRVTQQEIDQAAARVDERLVRALTDAATEVREFHEAQRPQDWTIQRDGRSVGQVYRPIRRVGVYAPGGLGAYPSTVLMTTIPAKVAGVERIVLSTPPDRSGYPSDVILAAAKVAGVTEIYRMGGAQAIAAMAYGTDTVPACDKIVGPGNVYVTLAKRDVFGVVGIDGLFGPSESLVVADEHADPVFAASELITQAEHAPDAAAIFVTTSPEMLEKTLAETEGRLRQLPRADVIREALASHGLAILVRDREQAAAVSNVLAPEHLCIHVDDPDTFLESVSCAGSVLIGGLSAAALSDYCAGPSHVLPTARSARFSSGLGVRDFLVSMNTVRYSQQAVAAQAGLVDVLAEAEDLEAHREAVRLRLDDQP